MAKLTVITGSMFSGKTSELQRLGRRSELGGKRVLFFKPAIDNRYSENHIVSHDKNKKEAISIREIRQICLYFVLKPDVVCIDEIQFFNVGETLEVIDLLLKEGVDVVVSGLDMDSDQNPFGAVPFLMSKAEVVYKLTAICSECGNDAWLSYSEGKSEQIIIGEKELYRPLCRACFYEKENVLGK